MILSRLKKLVKKLPVAFTKNQKYDQLTRQIIRDHCLPDSNCIDAGAHEGDVFDQFLKYAPNGNHYAFEPVPFLYDGLKKKYLSFNNCHIYPVALSNRNGMIPFNYVISNPAYSGIIKRKYDKKHEQDTTIEVETGRLDDIIPRHSKISFIKIDVEGGEMDVLQGAERILTEQHPLVVFEFGIGGSDMYGTTPEILFGFFSKCRYQLSLLTTFVAHGPALTLESFSDQFHNRKNYYFIAY